MSRSRDRYKQRIYARARRTRKRGGHTNGERHVAEFLSKHGIGFEQQHVILPYITDFYLTESNTVIEVDGIGSGRHATADERHRDVLRDEHMRRLRPGLRIIRISESQAHHAHSLTKLLEQISR